MRVLTVVQRYNSVSEPWLGRMIAGLGDECVGIAARTRADDGKIEVGLPFARLRSRNVFHRLLPKSLRDYSPYRASNILANFAKGIKADRILCHFGTVALEYKDAWKLLDLPLFVHFHGFDLMFDLREQDDRSKVIHPKEYKQQIVDLSQRAIFVANSQFSRRCLVEAGVAENRIRVNYLGVEPQPITDATRTGRPKILHVGRFVDCKGPDLTIGAFNRLRQSGVDAELIMVGDGAQRDRCLRIAAESPYSTDISLPGSEDQATVKRRLQEASVFTMHSIKGRQSNQEEAFGVAFLDAMAAGLPVVTGRSGGIPEIVQHERTGFLFDPGDIEAHASYLAQLIKNPAKAQEMGLAGRQVVQSQFTQEQSDKGLNAILNTV